MTRVLCAGHVNWDVTLRLDRLPQPDGESRIEEARGAGGGSAANVAIALNGLGLDSRLLGSVGDDEHGHLARRELEREPEGADLDLAGLRTVEGAATTVKYLLVADDGEVAVLANDGANEAIRPADLDPALLEGVEHCHLTSQRPDTAARLAGMASERGVTVSFDPGRRLADRDFAETVALADWLFVNEQEAESVRRHSSDGPPETGDLPVDGEQRVVIKHGAGGAALHGPDGSWSHPGFEVEPVDTTGAGDAFAAGFLAVTLDGGDTERALEFANACGALAATAEGARTAPDPGEVGAFLDGQF